MVQFSGKVAVITGAGSGIGRALAQQLAARGCRLALADVNQQGLEETAASLPQPVLLKRLDVADREAVYAFAEEVRATYGTAHFVINNAGVSVSQTIAEQSYEDFEWLMGINFWGVVYGTKAFLPMLTAQNEGTIVNLSSVFGIVAVPTQGSYNASKFAVRGFTECLRHELDATKVNVVCVHPGGIRTNIAKSSRYYAGPDGSSDQARAVQQFEKLTMTTPAKAAATIIRGIERGSARVLIGPDAHLITFIQRCFPVHYWRLMKLSLGFVK